MKAKVILQIVIIAIIGTAVVQAQENINRKVKKEMRKAKREVRQAQKEVKQKMKDDDWGAVYLDDVLADLDDVLVDLDDLTVDIDDIDDVLEDIDIDLREGTYLYKHSPKKHIRVHPPDFYFKTPDIDVKLPSVYKWKTFESESSNTFELSKELENVSISKDYYCDVKEGAESLSIDINGSLSSGDLKVSLKKPDGDIYQDFQLSPLADVDWSQKIEFTGDDSGMEGKWTLSLSGSAATGSYQIRIKSK